MYIIMGGTGHVGSVAARTLLEQGREVTIVTRDANNGRDWEARGAKVAVADVRNPETLRAVFRTGRRAFLLNPPASPDTDTDTAERETVRCILAALDGSGLEKVVAESTYGAQPGECLGDLNTLHDLEEGLGRQSIPFAIIRAAYYFSNWDALLEPARLSGALPTMLPADLKMPMVAPEDLGRTAATLLTESIPSGSVVYVEGPRRYSPVDVAAAFSIALGRPVGPAVTPRNDWEDAFRELGFSNAAARSYARMTAVVVDGDYSLPSDPVRGTTCLQTYVDTLARRAV